MSTSASFSGFLRDLQQLERNAPREWSSPASANVILEAFVRCSGAKGGVVYFREGSEGARLAARSRGVTAPESVTAEIPTDLVHLSGDAASASAFWSAIQPPPTLLVPLRRGTDSHGLVGLWSERPWTEGDELDLVSACGSYVGTLITNQRLIHEMREGDFQLKYRLWELESLYDIGLSIASTLNLEELAEEILLRTISLINARRAALFLHDGQRFALYRSFGDVRAEFLDEELDEKLAVRLLKEGQPITFESNANCIFPDCGSFVALPIRGNNDVIGVIAAADRETRDGGVGAFEENDLRLLSLFANQVAIALENARLHRQALEKQAMERELELAATIQRDILPKSIPLVPGFDLAAVSRPARQVGGDYHAFFHRDGALSLCIADVAGKSMPAALLVSALHAALQLLFEEGRDLGEIATDLNRHIHRWSAENKFITMILAQIDPEEQTIRYVNAGHNPAYMVVDGVIDTMRSHGLPVGILPQTRYATQTRSFVPGSLLLLYSDGITEAENVAGDEFGNDRLEAIVREGVSSSAAEIATRVTRQVEAFVAEAPQKDDETLVIARLLVSRQ
jgi:sigma-B regulation protein RsbU (phosphoserine phosphatase)